MTPVDETPEKEATVDVGVEACALPVNGRASVAVGVAVIDKSGVIIISWGKFGRGEERVNVVILCCEVSYVSNI